MRACLVLGLVLSFYTVGCAGASPPGEGTMPTALRSASTPASHLAAAKSLLLVTLSEEGVRTMTRMALDAILNTNPALEQLRPVFDEFFALYFTRDALVGATAHLYVERFSELELEQMRWFYSTPTGRRALVEIPALMRAGGEVGREIVEAHRGELQRMIREHVGVTPEAPYYDDGPGPDED